MTPPAIQSFKAYFSDLTAGDISALDEIYSPQVLFEDPIHKIEGRNMLKAYFHKLNQNLIQGSFHFTEEHILADSAYLSWEMKLQLKRPKKEIIASGISALKFQDQITVQRDYFDAGELFYEHVPIVGGIIRMLKKRLGKT